MEESDEVLILPSLFQIFKTFFRSFFIDSTTNTKKPSLLKVLIKTFGPGFVKTIFLKLLNDIMEFVNPQLLRFFFQLFYFTKIFKTFLL